ncbi:alginate lyase family protein [Alteromonas facilis]|uniref:alginate lyase family protein n=1 Tax=Alteromonas facilis TaxID=2048004 RepID=UPI000C293E83|nr:alginate lyase family protein [Alteromonas facilis]
MYWVKVFRLLPYILALVLIYAVTGCKPNPVSQALPEHLLAPPSFYKPTTFNREEQPTNCMTFPPYTERLNFPSRYAGSGSKRDQVNPESTQIYLEKTKPIYDFTQWIANTSDALYSGKSSAYEYTCLINNLHAWAQVNALLNIADKTGTAVRKWSLAALSSNYFKLMGLHKTDQALINKRNDIEKWLYTLAWQVKSDYTERDPKRVNNHDYWAAWAVIVTSVLSQDKKLYEWAEGVFDDAMNRIDDDGFISTELRRGSRAAHYHNFALAPLTAMAAFINANNRLSQDASKKITLAVEIALTTLNSTAAFEQETGENQVDPQLQRSGRLAWLPIYLSFAPDKNSLALQHPTTQSGNSRLGGDTYALYMPDLSPIESGKPL